MERLVVRCHLAQVARVRTKEFPHGSGAPVLIFGLELEFCRQALLSAPVFLPQQPCPPLELLSVVLVGLAPQEPTNADPLWLLAPEKRHGWPASMNGVAGSTLR